MSKNIITRIARIKTNIITIAIIVEQRQLEKYEHREHTKNRSNDRKKKKKKPRVRPTLGVLSFITHDIFLN